MMNETLAPPLADFVEQVGHLLGQDLAENELLPEIGKAMQALVREDNWLAPEYAKPHPEYYQQYLLYAAPDDSFSVVSFVWGPGQKTPIHDHTVWGVIGMLRGTEKAQGYGLSTQGIPEPEGDVIELVPGAVEYVSPQIGDIHRVQNALSDRVSISIHAYGANIGKVSRHVFSPETGAIKEFISGYSNPRD